MMEEPLTQFFIWWDGPDGKDRAVAEQESTYRIAQRAFAAGHAARWEPPIEPSRDALTAPRLAPGARALERGLTVSPEGLRELAEQRFRAHTPPLEAPEPDPFASVRLSGPQQAAMDSLYPLKATTTVWDGVSNAPVTLPMRVIPADMPVVGPVEPVEGPN